MVTEEMLQVFKEKCESIYKELGKDMIGQQDVVEGCVIAMIAGGNVLLEGVPGVLYPGSVYRSHVRPGSPVVWTFHNHQL